MRLAALVAAGLLALSVPAFAQYYGPRPMAPIGPLPPQSVFEMVRQMGLEPVGAPVRSGPVYFQRAADYYGRPLRVVIDAHRAQVMSVEPVGDPPMLQGGPYASTGAPYGRRPYPYRYGMPDEDVIAPPGSMMAPHGQPPQVGSRMPPPPTGPYMQRPQAALPPATQSKPETKSAAVTPGRPPVPRKRPQSAPQEAAGSVEPLSAEPQAAPQAPPAPAAAPAKTAGPEMTPVAPLN